MRGYFKTAGVLTLILFVAGAVYMIYDVIQLIQARTNGFTVFFHICLLVIFLIVGPALGLLLISHADSLEREETRQMEMVPNQINQPTHLDDEEGVTPNGNGLLVYQRFISTDGDTLVVHGVRYPLQEIVLTRQSRAQVFFTASGQSFIVQCNNTADARRFYFRMRNMIG